MRGDEGRVPDDRGFRSGSACGRLAGLRPELVGRLAHGLNCREEVTHQGGLLLLMLLEAAELELEEAEAPVRLSGFAALRVCSRWTALGGHGGLPHACGEGSSGHGGCLRRSPGVGSPWRAPIGASKVKCLPGFSIAPRTRRGGGRWGRLEAGGGRLGALRRGRSGGRGRRPAPQSASGRALAWGRVRGAFNPDFLRVALFCASASYSRWRARRAWLRGRRHREEKI